MAKDLLVTNGTHPSPTCPTKQVFVSLIAFVYGDQRALGWHPRIDLRRWRTGSGDHRPTLCPRALAGCPSSFRQHRSHRHWRLPDGRAARRRTSASDHRSGQSAFLAPYRRAGVELPLTRGTEHTAAMSTLSLTLSCSARIGDR